MLLNDDLHVRALVRAADLAWVQSPVAGVERRMLFRIGGERARATSIVRYAPGSRFSPHGHPGGEEFLVLEGVFQDETGDFPAGSYVRNPPGTAHAPGSEAGCVILVKLWQFRDDDRQHVVCQPGEGAPAPLRPGVAASRILFDGPGEAVRIEEWAAGEAVEVANPDGLELLVLDGGFEEGGERLGRWCWLRLPAGRTLRARPGEAGARVWLKAGPLLQAEVCAFEAEGSSMGEGI